MLSMTTLQLMYNHDTDFAVFTLHTLFIAAVNAYHCRLNDREQRQELAAWNPISVHIFFSLS